MSGFDSAPKDAFGGGGMGAFDSVPTSTSYDEYSMSTQPSLPAEPECNWIIDEATHQQWLVKNNNLKK